ncbi:MAG: ribbon-helix-helix protein, CopG family [Halobacteria archaeon]
MKRPPARVTIALNEELVQLIEKISREMKISKSELLRRALMFYCENRALAESQKIRFYLDMLPSGEHIILDVDHWLLFLRFLGGLPDDDKFWEDCKAVARSHAEQLSHKVRTPLELLERLEACNFFKLIKNSETDFTLLLGSEVTKKFVKRLLEDFFYSMGFQIVIKEDLAKLRLKVLKKAIR